VAVIVLSTFTSHRPEHKNGNLTAFVRILEFFWEEKKADGRVKVTRYPLPEQTKLSWACCFVVSTQPYLHAPDQRASSSRCHQRLHPCSRPVKMYPLYQDASTVLELMEKRKGTANRLSLNSSIRNKKACLAIAAETSRSSLLSTSPRACVRMWRLF
jgi:hypothetical protein